VANGEDGNGKEERVCGRGTMMGRQQCNGEVISVLGVFDALSN
jgi:hypothetical protein